MPRELKRKYFYETKQTVDANINVDLIFNAVQHIYNIYDILDQQIYIGCGYHFADIVDTTDISTLMGNLLAFGMVDNSDGLFKLNKPKKFPDLLSQDLDVPDIEIKVTLENNKPKGHLPKSGYYLICRYVLCDENGKYDGNRGYIPSIYQIRFGSINDLNFNIRSTTGDSGKTASVNWRGMMKLKVIYEDGSILPTVSKQRRYKTRHLDGRIY